MAGQTGDHAGDLAPISLMKDQVSALNQAGVHAAYLNSSPDGGTAL